MSDLVGQAPHRRGTPPVRSGAAKSIPPAEIRCRLAISRGWLELHKSGTFMKLTQSGAGLFAMLSEFQN
jgi:hypothetical protein